MFDSDKARKLLLGLTMPDLGKDFQHHYCTGGSMAVVLQITLRRGFQLTIAIVW
jgi:hypothetical protein